MSCCAVCGSEGHRPDAHEWDPELRAVDKAGLASGDVDAVIDILLAEDARLIVDEPYDRDGTPGRACLSCNTAWPAVEADEEPWHHLPGCPSLGVNPG